MAKKKFKDITISFIDEPASEDVTGSGVLITTRNHKILLDYGLSQSNDRYEDFLVNNRKTKEFKAKDIDLVFISHQHADHSLLCPKLYRDGCKGATIITQCSSGVFKIMAMDSCAIQERDLLVINAQHDKNYKQLYTAEDVNTMLEHTLEIPYNEKIVIDDELSFKLIPAGHLLGSCQIILYITNDGVTKRIAYSGDIGNKEVKNYFVGEYQQLDEYVDCYICEATYGDRPDSKTGIKERNNDLDKLKSIIDTQIKEMNGRVIIPTFAQSRMQQLALTIYQLYKDSEWQPKLYIDSPLSIAIFKEYAEILDGEEKEMFDELLKWDNLIFVKESEESKALVASQEPCIIASTSGFCNIGRIRHHLKAAIPNPNATVVFIGFASPDSLAGLLRDNKRKTITIDTKEYACRCACFNLKSFSGHAPFWQLIDNCTKVNAGRIILHHGSTTAKETLAKELKKRFEKLCKTTRVVIANSSLKFNL